MSQLALPVGLDDRAALDNFVPGANAAALAAVRGQIGRRGHPVLWLWGPPASGKSHLLMGAYAASGDDARYVAVDDGLELAAVRGLPGTALVCIDDVDRVARDRESERAVFVLFNRLVEAGGALIVSASASPRHVAFALPDLSSRLSSGPVFQLSPLTDEERIAALKLRAEQRGLSLPTEVSRYLLRHYRRDMATLYGLLDRLDAASLVAQRRLTVPFVKEVLESD